MDATFVVRRLWPERSRCSGTVTAGECGASPYFWGASLGCAFGYFLIAALVIAGPETLATLTTKLIIVSVLFGMLGLLLTPLIVCGFHKWRWNADGVEFVGVFRRQLMRWRDVALVRRIRRTGWEFLSEDGAKFSTSNYVPGERFIIRALTINRPDLSQQVASVIEDERAWP
jgi:hypothetical protein